MFVWRVLFLLMLGSRADAGEPPPAPPSPGSTVFSGEDPLEIPEVLADPPPETAETAEQRLSGAVRAYQEGRPEEARVTLAALVNDPALTDPELRQQARIYLGEVLYVGGQEDAAFKVFEVVLHEDPNYRVDPFRHPPDVCGFFEVVRASTSALTPRPTLLPTLPAPPPLSAWVGFGVYQSRHGSRPKGAVMMISQAGLGLASAAGYGWITSQRHYRGGSETLAHLQTLKAVQWGVTAGFWGIYAWGALDARADWRERGATAEGAAGAGVSGSW